MSLRCNGDVTSEKLGIHVRYARLRVRGKMEERETREKWLQAHFSVLSWHRGGP